MGIKAEDIIPENENHAVFNGVQIRKGTMGAALVNADILSSPNSTESEKENARNALKEIAAILANTSFSKHVSWNNPEIQRIFGQDIS
jgi:hypothetical protein